MKFVFYATVTSFLVFLIDVPDTHAAISYKGSTAATIVPGKLTPFTFEVKNTTTDATAVRVRISLDDSLKIVKFSAPNVHVEDGGWIWWDKVQIQPGKSFVVTLTLLAKAGTPVGTKFNVYVETVSYDPPFTSLGATDLPLTVVAKETVTTPARSSEISIYFRSVYGRLPTSSEKKYWIGRLKDKPTADALKGAMTYQKTQGKSPKVLGARSNTVYEIRLSDGVTKSSPGEIVTYSIKVTNKYTENTILTPQLSIAAKDLEIPAASHHGRRGKLTNGKPGGTVDWNYSTNPGQKRYEVKVDTGKSHTFTFQVKTPDAIGSEYCIEAHLFPFLQDEDCNTVVKSTGKKVSTAPTLTSAPPAKITENDFRIIAPESLNTDRADQEITWYATDKIKSKYPNVKIELCPGKDFKECIILDAVVENDGRHIINMPPIPRVGKWYLHLIGRDSDGNLRPSISASKRIELHK